ncbi:MAG: RsmE family RNA methyltransferase [Planctomycetota bacterium]|jgi:RsmE family RNA methyltransferase
MNLLLARPWEIESDGILQITGVRRDHLANVVGVTPQSQIRIGFPDSCQGMGVVDSVGDSIRIRHELNPADPPDSPTPLIHIILAMPRPKVLGRILSHMAALGVASIRLVRSWHVEKSYLQTDLTKESKSRELLLDGLEQARDTRVPQFEVFPLFRPFVEDELDRKLPHSKRILAHPTDASPMAKAMIGRSDSVVIAIGPERGWTPFECDLLAEHGFERVSLGARILRVETALTAAVSQVQLLQSMAALAEDQ